MNDRHQFDDLHQPIAMQERQPIIAQGAGLSKLWGGSKTALRFTGVKVTPDIAALHQKNWITIDASWRKRAHLGVVYKIL